MNIEITSNVMKKKINKKLKHEIEELFHMYLNESLSGNKVAFYYENINTLDKISYNSNICFYAASSIKILVCLILFEQATNKKVDLNNKIVITMKDLKQGTGIIKFQQHDLEYSIMDLIKLTIVESDNTAYSKLIKIVGKENIAQYGKKLGATHTMEGKDYFGIINCEDMVIYWKKIKEFIDTNQEYGSIFKEFLKNPTVKLINNNNINKKSFIRKYGSYDIAYHEAGYVEDKNPYYMIILTQLNKYSYKENFINDTAKKILTIHNELNKIKAKD